MSKKQCRTCLDMENDEEFEQITPYHAQILLDFGIKIPKFNICATICEKCRFFVEGYENFKENCIKSHEYFQLYESSGIKLEKFTSQPEEVILGGPDEEEEEIAITGEHPMHDALDDLIEVVEEMAYNCGSCGSKFENIDECSDHMGVCMVQTTTDESVEEEVVPEPPRKILKTPKSFTCSLCGVNCFTQKNLKEHLHKHRTVGYSCGQCKKKFSKDKDLIEHIKRIHPTPKKYFECSDCNLSFPTEIEHENHLVGVHCSEPHEFKCQYCAKICRSEHHLRNHKQKHETYQEVEILEGEETLNVDVDNEDLDAPLPLQNLYDAAKQNYDSVFDGTPPKLKPPCVKLKIQ